MSDRQVPAIALEGLIEGWRTKVSKHDFDGTPEEYQAFMEATESCAEDLEYIVKEHTGELNLWVMESDEDATPVEPGPILTDDTPDENAAQDGDLDE